MFKISILTSAFLFALATAKAQPTPTFTEVKTYLSLTDAQLTSLTSIHTAERSAAQSILEQMQTKRTALTSALSAGTTASAAGQLLLDIEALRKQLSTLNATYQTQASAVLSEAQKTKLKTLDEASKLNAQIHQATALNLLTPPAEANPGMGGHRGGFGGPGGPGGFAPFGGPGGRGPANSPFRRNGPPPPPIE
jgi:Spy/CpxP family protein refolding chaperone